MNNEKNSNTRSEYISNLILDLVEKTPVKNLINSIYKRVMKYKRDGHDNSPIMIRLHKVDNDYCQLILIDYLDNKKYVLGIQNQI